MYFNYMKHMADFNIFVKSCQVCSMLKFAFFIEKREELLSPIFLSHNYIHMRSIIRLLPRNCYVPGYSPVSKVLRSNVSVLNISPLS